MRKYKLWLSVSLCGGEEKGCETLGITVLLKTEFLEGLGEDEVRKPSPIWWDTSVSTVEGLHCTAALAVGLEMCCAPGGKGEG